MQTLYDSTNELATIDQGESLTLIFQARAIETDENGSETVTDIDAADLASLTLTLFDEADGGIINSRSAVDALDAGPGTVEVDGTVTVRLDAADAAINDADLAVGDVENHVARFSYTWNDGVSVRTGIHEVRFGVRKLATPT